MELILVYVKDLCQPSDERRMLTSVDFYTCVNVYEGLETLKEARTSGYELRTVSGF
jgi:hypothetical protein